MTYPTIDVILCTRNRGAQLQATLESLRASRYLDFQVYVVDQSTNDATARATEPFCRTDSRFHHIPSRTKGLDFARNIGAASGTGDVVAYIDDDCRADPGWVESLLREYAGDSQTWAVFGRTIPGENAQPDRPATKMEKALPMAMVDHKARKVFQGNVFDLGFGHGANMSFSRACFDRIGMFDELLGAGGLLRSWPERDFGYRILKAGGRIVFTPNALVHHDHWREWPEVIATYRNYAIGCGAAVGKYLRRGDYPAILLLLEWIWSQGFRQMASGLLRWRSWQKMAVGWSQVVYPFVGLRMGLRYRISDHHCVYLSPDEKS